MTVRDPEERFWEKVEPTGCCWWWKPPPNRYGYGQFHLPGGKKKQAHRYAYEILVGPIPEGLVLDHICRNTRCVNPDHLEPVTNRENLRRGMSGELKTHCKHGHAFDEINTLWVSGGKYRLCKACKYPANAARKRAKKEARNVATG